jgi:restriction system protein
VERSDYFINTQIFPTLSGDEARLSNRALITQTIVKRVYDESLARPILREFCDSMSPGQFEHFCAEQLRLSGWDARVTRASRDQGVEVVAERSGICVVLQCKLYSNPVGNKAVQEVSAAKGYEKAQHAVVVTNNRYTQPAEQLALTNGVLLLHSVSLPS